MCWAASAGRGICQETLHSGHVVWSCMLQGIQMQPDTVTQFQADIYGGHWDAALQLLPQLTFDAGVALQARASAPPCLFHTLSGHCMRRAGTCSRSTPPLPHIFRPLHASAVQLSGGAVT